MDDVVQRLYGKPAAHADAVAALPRISLAEACSTDQTASCTICMCAFAEEGAADDASVAIMPCGDAFHEACLLSWLERSNDCPLCRHALAPARPARPRLLRLFSPFDFPLDSSDSDFDFLLDFSDSDGAGGAAAANADTTADNSLDEASLFSVGSAVISSMGISFSTYAVGPLRSRTATLRDFVDVGDAAQERLPAHQETAARNRAQQRAERSRQRRHQQPPRAAQQQQQQQRRQQSNMSRASGRGRR